MSIFTLLTGASLIGTYYFCGRDAFLFACVSSFFAMWAVADVLATSPP